MREKKKYIKKLFPLAAGLLLVPAIVVTTMLVQKPQTLKQEASSSTTPTTRHVVASQGPTDPANLYIMVTWDRSDRNATGYEVLRNNTVIGSTTVTGDAWDDMAYKDTSPQAGQTYDYQVRPKYTDGTSGTVSDAYRIFVRSDANIGSGRIFSVDNYSGTDLQRAQAAVDAAKAAGGGVVQFAARTYILSGTLLVDAADNIMLRGAGKDQTFLQPGFAGTTTGCGGAQPLIHYRGTRTNLSGVALSKPIVAGDKDVSVTSTAGLSVGQVIIFDQKHPQNEPTYFQNLSIPQDPGSGNDLRYPWDANEITAINGSTVTFKYPFSHPFTTAVTWQWLQKGAGNGLELMTIQGRSATEDSYQRLVDLDFQAHFSAAELHGRWANRNYFKVNGYDIKVVGFRGSDGGPKAAEETCLYKFSVYQASNFTFIGGEMGDTTARNGGYLTLQFAQRVLVRNSKFYNSTKYAINEHGGGSRHHIYENNHFSGIATTEGAAVWLGNTTWGFGGPTIVRNSTFENNYRDFIIWDNPYEVRILDNVSRGCKATCVLWNGWGGIHNGYSPIPDSNLWGSSRLVVARNRFENAYIGLHLGYTYSSHYPYLGIKDVIIKDNYITATNNAIRLYGDSTSTNRFQVSGNTGKNSYTKPTFVEGDYWSGNADGISYGSPTAVNWDTEYFEWQLADNTPLAGPNTNPTPTPTVTPTPTPAPTATPTPTTSTTVDTTKPTVTISSPAQGATIGNSVYIAGSGTDNVKVTKMEIYIEGRLMKSTSSSPISYTWNSKRAKRGMSYTITVKAYDAANNAAQSSVTVTKQ